MSAILLFLGIISISLLILGFLKSNSFIQYSGFILLSLIIFTVVYFLFLTPPESFEKHEVNNHDSVKVDNIDK
ncbi:hypothetical protein [Staphylococcus casei]|uniref:Uncharacterized protein n=1 Tax=Staphylococcus casei TaxID=201828 RepID=A0ABZ2WEY1_9STAP